MTRDDLIKALLDAGVSTDADDDRVFAEQVADRLLARFTPTGTVAWQFGVRVANGFVHFIEGASHNEVKRMVEDGGGTFMRRRITVGDWEEAS